MVLLFPPGTVPCLVSSPVQSVRRSSDGADGAATLILHGLPSFQLSGDSPPDALQVQAPVELARAQGDAERRDGSFQVCWRTVEFFFFETTPSCPTGSYGWVLNAGQSDSLRNSSHILGADCPHCVWSCSGWDTSIQMRFETTSCVLFQPVSPKNWISFDLWRFRLPKSPPVLNWMG